MRNHLISALFLVLSLNSAAFAAHPLISDDTGTQGSGRYSLEVNGEVSHSAGDGVRQTAAEVAVILSAGMAENLDLVLGVPFQHLHVKEAGNLDEATGPADLTLELKWRLYERNGFSLALKPGIALPTGDEDKGLGNGRVSYGATLIASQELKPLTLHLNLGYTRTDVAGDDSRRADILSASLAATTPLTEKVLLVANVGGESNGLAGNGTWPAFALAGAIWNVRENLDLDLGVKAGLNHQEADVTALAGMVVRF